MHARVQHPDQQLRHLDPDPGQPDGEGVGAQQQHRPHDLGSERLTDAGGMAADQVALQLGGLGRLDADVGQIAEARRDAVDGGAAADESFDHGPRRVHPLGGACGELDRSCGSSDLHDIGDRQVASGECERRGTIGRGGAPCASAAEA